MTAYRKAADAAVTHYPTKYDLCTIHGTGKPYKFQAGSGRARILNEFGAEGRTIGEITKLAAEVGFDPNFTVSAILKQHDTKDGGWTVKAPEGKTLETIKAERQERRVDPETAAKKAEKEAAKKARADAREAKKADKDRSAQEKAALKATQKAEKDAAKEAKKAAKKAAKDAAAVEATAKAAEQPATDAPAAEQTEATEATEAAPAPKQSRRQVRRGAVA
jgi:hypothetical protein